MDAAQAPTQGTSRPLAEAAQSWFACNNQEMSLVRTNINNFTEYGRSKGADFVKFYLFYCIFELTMFAQQIIIHVKPNLQISSGSKMQ